MAITTDPKSIKSGYPDDYDGWGADMNANLRRFSAMGVESFAYDSEASAALSFAYRGAFLRNPITGAFFSKAAGAIALTNNTINYVEADIAGTVSKNTVGFSAGRSPIAEVTTAGGVITQVLDRRTFMSGGAGGASRDDIALETEAIAFEETAEGTVDMGATSLPVRVTSSHKAWFRLYATAADRTADNARAIDEDPTTPILLELIFEDALEYKLDPAWPMVNADEPATNLLYYSVVMLDPQYGGNSLDAEDLFPLLVEVPVSQWETLDNHTFSDPDGSDLEKWEFTSDNRERYICMNNGFGNAVGGAAGRNVGTAPTTIIARSDADIGNDLLECWLDMYRRNDHVMDNVKLCFCVKNTAIGVFTNDDFLFVELQRTGAGTVELKYTRRAAGGADTVAATVSGIAWATQSVLRLGITIDGTVLTVYTKVGSVQTLRITDAIPDGLQSDDRKRVGFYNMANAPNNDGFLIQGFRAIITALPPAEVTVTTERVKIEEVAA